MQTFASLKSYYYICTRNNKLIFCITLHKKGNADETIESFAEALESFSKMA